jgi:outer membrane immunogenic protein
MSFHFTIGMPVMVFATVLRKTFRLLSFLGAFLCLGSVSPARAQTMMNANINGLYLGGHWGAGIGIAGATTTTGMLGGAQAGYNIQYNSVLLGAEADVTAAGLHARGYVAGSYKQNFMTSLKARLGYVSGNLMVALQGGPAFTTLAYHDASGFSDKSVAGYVGGINLSYAMTDKIILRADVLRYDFGKPTFSTINTPHLPLASNTNLVRAGFDYRL